MANVKKSSRSSPEGFSPRKALEELESVASSFVLKESDYFDVAAQLWANLNTPLSLRCYLLCKHQEWDQLVASPVVPYDYCDLEWVSSLLHSPGPSQFQDDYQSCALLAKWPNFEHPGLDPVGRCIDTDNAAEEACRASNRRIRRALREPEQAPHRWLHLITMMQDVIKSVLGPFDPTRWMDECRFGPGHAQGQDGTLDYEKLLSEPTVTSSFAALGTLLITSSEAWLDALDPEGWWDPQENLPVETTHTFGLNVLPGDVNIMVPKNAKTHRGIRPQPGLNVFAQLGLGMLMRQQLLKHGLDLNDQRPNQVLAQRGSRPGSDIVTVDLRCASGHICKALVEELFSTADAGWLEAMRVTRTDLMLPHGVEDKPSAWVPLQSWSAMGNGYTFEMETLIFWAAVRVCRRYVRDHAPYRVYGDDIICGQQTAVLLLPFLAWLGFPCNSSKTFLEGPFRESCGADYWNGHNVRPIHFSVTADELKEGNNNGTSVLRWIQVCNSIRRLARQRNHGFGCDRLLLPCWRTAILRIPRSLRNNIKAGWSDDRDTFLITHTEDALTNPLVRRCGSLQTLVSPNLFGTRIGRTPDSYLGMRAALLYRRKGDRVVCRYDRRWSTLQRVLQLTAEPVSKRQAFINRITGITPGVELRGELLPATYGMRLSAGWEVFQPVTATLEWM